MNQPLNRRSLLSFLGLAPVAVATAAMGKASDTEAMTRLETSVTALSMTTSGMLAKGALDDARHDLAFERHGAEWLQRAYADNITVEEHIWRRAGEGSAGIVSAKFEISFRDFVGPDDDVFITPSSGAIYIFNKTTDREAHVPRPALRITA